jgi:hypothetical protein
LRSYANYVYTGMACLEECKAEDYAYDVSTTELSEAFINYHKKTLDSPVKDKYIAFTIYYKSFDVTKIAYHGKVILQIFKH